MEGIVAAEHDDAVLVTTSREHFRGRKPGGTATDDYNLFGMADGRLAATASRSAAPRLLHTAIFPSRCSTFQHAIGKRRRPEGLARAQIETGVVPGATHRVANQEALGERPLIMGALGTDREHLAAAAHQQNLLVAGMTDEHPAIGELIESDALGKVWTGELFSSCIIVACLRDLESHRLRCLGCGASASINHAQEFLPRQRIVTEAAQHSARD